MRLINNDPIIQLRNIHSVLTPTQSPLTAYYLQSPSYPLYLSRSSLCSSKSSVYSSKRASTAWSNSESDNVLSVSQLITNWVTVNKSSFNPDHHVNNLCLRCGKPHDTVKVALVGSDRTVAAMAMQPHTAKCYPNPLKSAGSWTSNFTIFPFGHILCHIKTLKSASIKSI